MGRKKGEIIGIVVFLILGLLLKSAFWRLLANGFYISTYFLKFRIPTKKKEQKGVSLFSFSNLFGHSSSSSSRRDLDEKKTTSCIIQ